MLLFNVIAIQINAPAPKVYDSTNPHFEAIGATSTTTVWNRFQDVLLKDYILKKKIPLFRLTSFGTPQILYGGWGKTSHTISMEPLFSQFGRVWDNVAGQQGDTLTQTSPPPSHSSVSLRYSSLAARPLHPGKQLHAIFSLSAELWIFTGTNFRSFWLSSVLDSRTTFIQ